MSQTNIPAGFRQAVTVVLALFLAGCGGGDLGKSDTSAPAVAAPRPPVVSAGDDFSATEGATFTLTGVYVDSLTITDIAWEQIDGPGATLQNADQHQVSITAPSLAADASITLRYTVTNGAGLSASDEIDIAISALPEISDLVFPDVNLAQCISDSASSADISDISEMTELECISLGITDLTGLDSLTYLINLDIGNSPGTFNQGTANPSVLLQQTSNPRALVGIVPNAVKDVSVLTNLPELESLGLSGNIIETIDLSKNKKLIQLDVSGNSLPSLSLTTNRELEFLDASDNHLTSIALNRNTELTDVVLDNNKIESLNLNSNPKLTSISLEANLLVDLDLSNNPVIEVVNAAGNSLSSIDISENIKLTELDVSNNQLTHLDASNNVAMTKLDIAENNITDITISDDPVLEEFDLTGNPLPDETLQTLAASIDVTQVEITFGAPSAVAGDDQSVSLNQTVTLSGDGSYDLDGDAITYSWQITTRPEGSDATLSTTTGVATTFVADTKGRFDVSLTVTAQDGSSDPDVVTISVPNSAPLAGANPPDTSFRNTAVSLEISLSTDADNDSLSGTWQVLSSPPGATSQITVLDASTSLFQADLVGDYELSLIVNDGDLDSSPVSFQISIVNIATQVDAGADQVVLVGNKAQLEPAIVNEDDDALTYTWTILSGPTGGITLSNKSTRIVTVSTSIRGAYELRLSVSDGNSTVSDNLVLTTKDFGGTVSTYTVGTLPLGIDVGDVNQDGVMDIVSSNSGSNSLSILLGDQDGSFTLYSEILTTGNSPRSLIITDMDNDSENDIVVLNEGDSFLSIFYGGAELGLFDSSSVAAPSDLSLMAIADLDGDDLQDILMLSELAGDLSFIAALAGRSFSTSESLTTFDAPMGISIGLIDADEFLDLAVSVNTANEIAFYTSDRSGTLTFSHSLTTVEAPGKIGLLDLNGDNFADLVVLDSNSDLVASYLNDNGSSFNAVDSFMTGFGSEDLLLVDINQDGKPDLITSNFEGNSISVHVGNGDGTFAEGIKFFSGLTPTSMVSADFDQDELPDIAVSNYIDNEISVLSGTSIVDFLDPIKIEMSSLPADVVAVDINADGYVDIVTVHPLDNSLEINFGKADGSYETSQIITVGALPTALATADINNNAIPDLLVVNAGSDDLSILLDGATTVSSSIPVGTNPELLLLADLDGDAYQDIVVLNTVSSDMTILLGDESGSFAQSALVSLAGSANTATVTDLNGDGNQDLVVAIFDTGNIIWFAGNGDGTFADAVTAMSGTSSVDIISSGDFDGDGDTDILSVSNADKILSILTVASDGTLVLDSFIQLDFEVGDLMTTYLNGDDYTDILLSDSESDDILLFLSDSSTDIANIEPRIIKLSPGVTALTTEDMNADGIDDIVAASPSNVDVFLAR